MFRDIIFYFIAAFFEIFGCYAFWMAIKLQKSQLWLVAGIISLILFAISLAKIDVSFAGKTYAIYGGIYILSSILWLIFVEKTLPNKWEIFGAIISIIGAMIIFFNSKN